MAEEKISMTQEGWDKLNQEYRHLIDVDRTEVIEALKAARSQGDLSENADYAAARDRQAQIEARIAEIEHIFDITEIVNPPKASSKKVTLSSLVTYREVESGEENQVMIVGTIEADPFAEPTPKISNESALGSALNGHKVGDVVEVASDEPYKVEVLKIESSLK